MQFFNSPNPAPNPRRVRIFAAEKSIVLDLREVSIVKREQKSPEYLALNPRGQTPSLAIGIMRQNIAAALDGDYPSALLREAEGQRIAGASADAMEGGLSFLEKRKPAFKGR